MSDQIPQVELHEQPEPEFQRPDPILLQPGTFLPRTGRSYNLNITEYNLEYVFQFILKSELVVLDLETRGSDYSSESLEIVGIGLAWDTGSGYIPYRSISGRAQTRALDLVYKIPRLVAHNIYFDGGVLFSKTGKHPNWAWDTLALYMQTSNEGYTGQTWGLKQAQVHLLGWQEQGDLELDAWLIQNGYTKGNGSAPDKGEMWRAPDLVLGKYCILDAEATYLILTEILLPVVVRFPALVDYHQHEFMHLIKLHIEQKMWGLLMDRPGLKSRIDTLNTQVSELSSQFLCHPAVLPHITRMEEGLLSELASKEPARYKKLPERPQEPPKYIKTGEISKNWIKWVENEHKYTIPVQSKSWENWLARWEDACSGLNPDYKFNLNSGPQLRRLIYEELGYPVSIRTETGEPAVSNKALKKLPDPFPLLVERAYLVKELSYLEDYLERTETRDTMHPSFRLPGTSTGRLSSKGPNLQQVPKSHSVMSLFQARPGNVWVDLDFSALEPVVTAEFSEDKNMHFIYGDGAAPNDIYLFIGAQIPGRIGDKIRATGFDPYNPSKETLARAKKECKSERAVCKTVVLACAYGAGVNKVNATLEADNIFLPQEEVEAVWNTYWNTFREVKQFARKLEREWEKNGGYILNGIGRPICVLEDYKKDLLNRFIQSTGHDLLVKYVQIYTQELDRLEIPWQPNIIDFHDASSVEVPKQYGQQVAEVMSWAVGELNRQLQGTISLRGVPCIGINLAETKEVEE